MTSRYSFSGARPMTASTRHFMYLPIPGFLILLRSKAIFIRRRLFLPHADCCGMKTLVAGPDLLADHCEHGVENGVMHVLNHLHITAGHHRANIDNGFIFPPSYPATPAVWAP